MKIKKNKIFALAYIILCVAIYFLDLGINWYLIPFIPLIIVFAFSLLIILLFGLTSVISWGIGASYYKYKKK